MKTSETAKTINDLIDYYCMRCVVGLSNCKISALECARIRDDIDFQEATRAEQIKKTTNYHISNSDITINL